MLFVGKNKQVVSHAESDLPAILISKSGLSLKQDDPFIAILVIPLVRRRNLPG